MTFRGPGACRLLTSLAAVLALGLWMTDVRSAVAWANSTSSLGTANETIAQTSEPAFLELGQIRGSVVDCPSGKPISGARITLRELNRGTVSSREGAYLFWDLPPGTYTLSIRSPDEAVEITRSVEVRAGETTRVYLQLALESRLRAAAVPAMTVR